MAKALGCNMVYEELHNRYGSHVARRVQQELSAAEFSRIPLSQLLTWLEARAEDAHKNYLAQLDNPFAAEESGKNNPSFKDLYARWQQAEELAYIIAVAEDVSAHAHITVGAK